MTYEDKLKDIEQRLTQAKEQGQEYFGEVIFNIANNKIVSCEVNLQIKEKNKTTLV